MCDGTHWIQPQILWKTSYRCRLCNETCHLMVSCRKNVKQEKEIQFPPSELDQNGFQRVREEERHTDGYRNIEEKQIQKLLQQHLAWRSKGWITAKGKCFRQGRDFNKMNSKGNEIKCSYPWIFCFQIRGKSSNLWKHEIPSIKKVKKEQDRADHWYLHRPDEMGSFLYF